MRFFPFLVCCFLLILFLPFIPHHETTGSFTIYYPGSLPDLVPFSIICISILVLAVLNKMRVLNKKMSGKNVLTQFDLSIKNDSYVAIALLVIAVLISRNLLYYLIVLASAMAYLLIHKLLIQKITPNILAIADDNIFYKSIFRIKKIKMESLRELDYLPMQKMLKLKFTEGLDEISLYTSDFKTEDLNKMVDELLAQKADTLVLSKNFAYFLNARSG